MSDIPPLYGEKREIAKCSKWPQSKTAFQILLKIEIHLYFTKQINFAKFKKNQKKTRSLLKLPSEIIGVDRHTDTQLFGRYHKISNHFLWQGIKMKENICQISP